MSLRHNETQRARLALYGPSGLVASVAMALALTVAGGFGVAYGERPAALRWRVAEADARAQRQTPVVFQFTARVNHGGKTFSR